MTPFKAVSVSFMVIASFRYTVNSGAAAAAPQVNVGAECQRV